MTTCSGIHPGREAKIGPYDLSQCFLCWRNLNRGRPGAGAPPATAPLVRRPLPCVHLGAPTGRQVECGPCKGKARLKVHACAVHGECTLVPGGGLPSCPCEHYEPDTYRPAAASPNGARVPPEAAGHRPEVRHLLYHVYPHARDGGALWRRNVLKLRRRLSLFNGRRVIAVAVGPGTDSTAEVRSALAGCDCHFLEVENNARLREAATLVPLLESVSAFTGAGHVTLFAHAKGVTSEYRPQWDGVRRWVDALYSLSLDHWPAVARMLAQYPLAGPFRRLGYQFPEVPTSTWHYSGSWRWFRNRDLFARDWRGIDPVWVGAESHPSRTFAAREAGCLGHQVTDQGLCLYLEDYWRRRAGPDVEAWLEDHLADRWQPLLVTCILTSHRKPGLVHEAAGSVLAQTTPDWQLVLIDSGELYEAGEFERYRGDPRVLVLPSGETADMRGRVCLQSWCVNECFRRGLVRGDLVVYLSDDDVFDPGAFAGFLSAARADPEQSAWYGRAERTEVWPGGERRLGELPERPLGPAGAPLCGRVDGMQVCHRTAVRVPWPEDPALSYTADGKFMEALGGRTPIHPLPLLVGRHRHTGLSTFTRPGGVEVNRPALP